MTFSENLQQLRKNANLSQEKLAERLCITRQAVSKWESGQSLPDAETCIKLCEIFGISPNRLLLGESSDDSRKSRSGEKTGRFSDFAVIIAFLMMTLLCGTAMLIFNLYNGNIFEPKIHTMSTLMILGSMAAFIAAVFFHILRKRK